MGKKREGRETIDPAPRLAMMLIRYSRGWFEQRQLAEALGVAPSQISMWERGDRPIPREAMEATANRGNIPPALLAQILREIRTFLQVSRGRRRRDRAVAAVAALDLLPALLAAADVVLLPGVRPAEEGPEETEALWARLARRTAEERLLLVEEGEEYQTRAVHDRVLAESAARAAADPREAEELARLAGRIAGILG